MGPSRRRRRCSAASTSTRRTTWTARSRSPRAFPPHAWAARSKSGRSWSADVKYALLLYDNPDAWQNVGDDEIKEMHEEYMAVAGEPESYGGAQLGPSTQAKVVRGEL